MQNSFNITAWLIQTFALMAIFLISIPVLKALTGLMLIAIGNGLSLKNQSVRNVGIKLLPAFLKGAMGVSIGLGASGLIAQPSMAITHPQSSEPVTQQISSFQIIETSPGDSLWSISLEALRRSNPNIKIGEVDSFWRLIWDLNREAIGEDPGLLKPGIQLKLPSIDRAAHGID